MLIIWFLLTALNVFTWLVVYSNFQELSDITRLEDMAKLKMSTLSSLNASRSFSHHSLDSANPYGRYGGTGVGSGTGSLQPSPQIYHHSLVTNQPLTIHESHQNIVSSDSRPSASHHHHHHQPPLPTTPRSHHSSQNSLHASYLQMYSNTLSQRSRQSSAASLSMNSSMANAFPMQSYTSNSNNQPQQQSSSSLQQHHHNNQQSINNMISNQQSRLNNAPINYGSAAFSSSYSNRHNNTPM